MVSIKWGMAQEHGLKLIEPNQNMCISYLGMAEESVKVIDNVSQSKIWTATTTYYIFYYALYALMIKLGVKCEIHSCSLKFMKQFLMEIYSPLDLEMIESAFSARTDLQYYANRPVNTTVIEENKKYCKGFYLKTKDVIARITDAQIENIRKKLIIK